MGTANVSPVEYNWRVEKIEISPVARRWFNGMHRWLKREGKVFFVAQAEFLRFEFGVRTREFDLIAALQVANDTVVQCVVDLPTRYHNSSEFQLAVILHSINLDLAKGGFKMDSENRRVFFQNPLWLDPRCRNFAECMEALGETIHFVEENFSLVHAMMQECSPAEEEEEKEATHENERWN